MLLLGSRSVVFGECPGTLLTTLHPPMEPARRCSRALCCCSYICVCMYIYIYNICNVCIYIYIYRERDSICIYIYIYIYVNTNTSYCVIVCYTPAPSGSTCSGAAGPTAARSSQGSWSAPWPPGRMYVYAYAYVCIYNVYIYIYIYRERERVMCIYIYIYILWCIYIYILYIEREMHTHITCCIHTNTYVSLVASGPSMLGVLPGMGTMWPPAWEDVLSVFIISNRKISNWASQILKANMLLICPYWLNFQIASLGRKNKHEILKTDRNIFVLPERQTGRCSLPTDMYNIRRM